MHRVHSHNMSIVILVVVAVVVSSVFEVTIAIAIYPLFLIYALLSVIPKHRSLKLCLGLPELSR